MSFITNPYEFPPVRWTKIDAGGSGDGDEWIASTGFSNGSTVNYSTSLDTSALTNPAPETIYRTARENGQNAMNWSVTGLAASSYYKFRFHFFTGVYTQTNTNIQVSGKNAVSQTFETGGKAYIHEAFIRTDGSGNIALVWGWLNSAGSWTTVSGIEYRREDPPIDPLVTANVLCEGDSITEGYPFFQDCWPKYMATSLGSNYYRYTEPVTRTDSSISIRNQSYRGADFYFLDIRDEANSEIDAYYDADKTNILILHIGSNDIAESFSAATVQTRILDYCQSRQAAGWAIIATTIMDRTDNDAGKDAIRASVNTWIRANWSTYANALVDLDADSRLDDASDSTYFVDVVHPTKAGHQVIAELMEPALTDLIDLLTSDNTAPTVPGTPNLTVISDVQIDGDFTGSTDAESGVARYILRRATDEDFTLNVVDTNLGLDLTFSATGLSSETSYWFKVLARDFAGNSSAYSTAAMATTDPPSALVHAVDIGRTGGGTISGWEQDTYSTGGATTSSGGTKVYPGISDPPSDTVISTVRYDGTGFDIDFTGLTPGHTYTLKSYSWWDGAAFSYTIKANTVLKATVVHNGALDVFDVKEAIFTCAADGSGNIHLDYDSVSTFALVNAIRIFD